MEMKPLFKLFDSSFFRIPDYQRGYAWKKEKQLPETWDDIEEILDNENNDFHPHFMGTLFVEIMKPCDIPEVDRWVASGNTFYSVVDGQQRLTTISILLFVLLSIEKTSYANKSIEGLKEKFIFETNATKNTRAYRFAYLEERDNAFLQSQIFEDKNIAWSNENKTESAYEKNLRDAKDYFYEKVYKMSYEERNRLFRKITNALYFDIHVIEKDLNVQSVFETMNNRGKPLTVLEKLKNRLMYLTEKLATSEEKILLRSNIRNTWGTIYRVLAKNPNNILDEDDFLSAHLSLYRKPPEYVFSEKQTEEKIFKMFCNRASRYRLSETDERSDYEEDAEFNKINKYVLDLGAFVSWWNQVNNTDNILINKIYLLYSGKEIKIYLCALLRALDRANQTCDDDLRKVEKILFRNATPGVGVRDPRTFATLARELYNNPTKLQEIRATLDNDLSKPINVEAVVGGFSHLLSYIYNSTGYHKWGSLKYFLFEYENELYCKRYKQDAEKILFKNYENTQIEHVLPRDEKPFWINETNDFSSNFTTDDSRKLAIRVLKNTLGNLTILKDKKNASVSKNPWNDDANRGITGKKTRFATGSFSEIEISQVEHWDKKAIYERGRKLLDYLFVKLDADGIALTEDQYKRALFYSVELFDTGFTNT